MSVRRLTLLDAMIVIAATAVAIAWTRATVAEIAEETVFGLLPWPTYLTLLGLVAVPPLMSGSIAVCLIRLRRPRPSWRRLTRQSGAVACVIAALALAIQWAQIVIGMGLAQIPGMTVPRTDEPYWFSWWSIAGGLSDVGLAVIGAWFILALGRRWGAEPSAIDRAGRLLGACWGGLFLIQKILLY